jgi:hypothetical protein
MKAELDPIYAQSLHKEFIHGTSTAGRIAAEQKKELEAAGGKAVSRDHSGGVGSHQEDTLKICERHTGYKYARISMANKPEARDVVLDSIAIMLKQGRDVPITMEWTGGGRHAMVLTDVRGKSPDELFLLTDPWAGKTVWLTRQQLVSGQTTTPAGVGRLTDIY